MRLRTSVIPRFPYYIYYQAVMKIHILCVLWGKNSFRDLFPKDIKSAELSQTQDVFRIQISTC